MATALEQSRERYARLRAPEWVPDRLTVPETERTQTVVEHSAAALSAYHHAACGVRVQLLDGTHHSGWIEAVYTVRDPDRWEGTRGAALLVPPHGDGVAFDLAHVRYVDECRELSDRI